MREVWAFYLEDGIRHELCVEESRLSGKRRIALDGTDVRVDRNFLPVEARFELPFQGHTILVIAKYDLMGNGTYEARIDNHAIIAFARPTVAHQARPALRERSNNEVTWKIIAEIFTPQLVRHARERMTRHYGPHQASHRLWEGLGAVLRRSMENEANRVAAGMIQGAPRDNFSYLDISACRVLYEAEFDLLVSRPQGNAATLRRHRQEWLGGLQRVVDMRNRLAHDSNSPDLRHDEAEGVLIHVTRLLTDLGYPDVAQQSIYQRGELVGSPRSVRAASLEPRRQEHSNVSPQWRTSAQGIVVLTFVLMCIAVVGAWILGVWPFEEEPSRSPSPAHSKTRRPAESPLARQLSTLDAETVLVRYGVEAGHGGTRARVARLRG
jgi:hypothetical protein